MDKFESFMKLQWFYCMKPNGHLHEPVKAERNYYNELMCVHVRKKS